MSVQEVTVKEKKKQRVCDRCGVPGAEEAASYALIKGDKHGDAVQQAWSGDLCADCLNGPVLNAFTKRTRAPSSRTPAES